MNNVNMETSQSSVMTSIRNFSLRDRMVAGVLIFWCLALFGMALHKQLIRGTGKSCKFRAAPVDPRDIFRGDFVILGTFLRNLDFSNISNGTYFYVPLFMDSDGFARTNVARPLLHKPSRGLFIRGQMGHSGAVFGIERYFVPEGKGRLIERVLWNDSKRVGIQVSIEETTGHASLIYLLVDGSPVDYNKLQDEETRRLAAEAGQRRKRGLRKGATIESGTSVRAGQALEPRDTAQKTEETEN